MKKTSLPAIFLLLISCFALLPFSARSQEHFNYDKAWEKVDSLALEGLPRSALLEIGKIYARAGSDKDNAMLLKAVIHRMLFQSYTEEESFGKILEGLQNDLREAEFPVKQVLHSLLADTYWKYYQQNRYRLFQRSTVADTSIQDFRNWDYERLLTEVIGHYRHSLGNREIQRETNISILAGALEGDTASRFLRPSLYDFLAQRAADFYIQEESSLTPRPEEEFLFDKPGFFSDAATFTAMPIHARDSLSLPVRGLQLLQELTRFHLDDQDPSALVDVELKRLEFIHRKSKLLHKDSLYVLALEKLMKGNKDIPMYSEVAYTLSNFYYNNNSPHLAINERRPVWNPGEQRPMALIKARGICEEAITRYPGSFGAKNCRNLLERIHKKEMEIRAENVNIPAEPFRLLVTYRNLPQVYIRVVKLSENEVDSVNISGWRRDPRWKTAEKLLLSKPPVLEYRQPLPGTEDHYKHSAEVRIDALPPGNYAVLASENEDFNADTAALTHTFVEVSGLSAFNRSRDQLQEIYVTGRKWGDPLENVRALVYKLMPKNGKSVRQLISRTHASGQDGKLSIILPRGEQYRVVLTGNNDTLTALENLWVTASANKPSRRESEEKTIFFTDRSVYRPGQTVHFKGFMLLSGTKTRIWPNELTEVSFYDANDEEISALELISNEFGTFSGTFIIPETGLPGKMSIENEYGQVQIEVAEYKRPTFEVNFETASEIYRLNDSVKVTGTAKSFSGYPIDRSQVKYTVSRSDHSSLLWHRYIYPRAEPLQIANGVLETDGNGKFTITFLAEARDTSKVYSYQVSADITDLNGETRSGNTSVNIGNKNLIVSANIGPEIFTGEPLKYQVGARNLNGQPQESNISLNIYALKAPEKLLRKRLWDAPDQYVMSREEFKKSFPYDVYSGEDDYQTWERGKECLKLDFHTDSIKTVDLERLRQCESGFYLAEISVKAASGETASQKYYFHLQQEKPGRPQTVNDFIKVLKSSGRPGESAEFLAGTGYKTSPVLYEVLSGDKILDQRWVSTGKIQEKIALPLTASLAGKLAVQFTLVHQNRIYHVLQPIQIDLNDEDLDIEMLSFRDKLRPGEQESWTIKITAPGNEKVEAEMAATLYDASLDDILPHSWPVNGFASPSYYSFHSFSWNTGRFLNESRNIMLREFRENNADVSIPRTYEQLQMYGYAYYGAYNSAYRAYLSKVKEKKRLENAREAWEEAFRLQSESMGEGIVIQGTVRDEKGNFLPGVSIIVKGHAGGVATSMAGEYKIKASENGILAFSMIGYESREIRIGSRKKIDVILTADPSALEEVVVVGFGTQKKADMTGSITIRGLAAAPPSPEEANAEADGEDAGGVQADLSEIIPRKNFNETAFFYPQLRTDEEGKISMEFTMPESITRWKMLGLAHTKELRYASLVKELVTSKEVSVAANAPRFLRAEDRFSFTAKVVNLTGEALQGEARLQLLDALTLQAVDSLMLQGPSSQDFSMEGYSSKTLSWELEVPEGLQALTYRVIASAGRHSDGEENTLPVLPNSILITETLPLQVGAGDTRDFSIGSFPGKKLSTARPYRFTLEFTSNPAWYAVQSLPYLMEYPYECAEQLFSRYFANSVASTIMNSSPRIKAIFRQWKATGSDELLSTLEKNQELKSALLEETPWVMQSNKESERKRRLGLLFDLNKMQHQSETVMRKLSNMQLSDGSFPWFAGMRGNRFITQHILAGIGQLRKLNALQPDPDKREAMVKRALNFTDRELANEYTALTGRKDFAASDQLNAFAIHYLYMRSFFSGIKPDTAAQKALDFYLGQAEEYWLQRTVYQQGMIALVLQRNGRTAAAQKIIRSLKERAQVSDEKGMYWTNNRRGYFWHEAPIETQALLIEAFSEIAAGTEEVEQMKIWLLLNKQTNNWESTKATVAACYALLLRGSDWLEASEEAEISLGGKTLEELKPGLKKEAGTGYLKTSWEAEEINKDMEEIRISNPGKVLSWGALYWQYFEKPENVPASGEGLSIRKTLYKETATASGPLLVPLGETTPLQPGDLVKVRMELHATRDYEYVHLKDLRAAAFEPLDVLARYHYQDGLGYYQATKDASTNFFISYLPKGTYVLEYSLRVTHAGKFSNGFASVQCMYAPEFSARSEGMGISVGKAE